MQTQNTLLTLLQIPPLSNPNILQRHLQQLLHHSPNLMVTQVHLPLNIKTLQQIQKENQITIKINPLGIPTQRFYQGNRAQHMGLQYLRRIG